MSVKRDRFDHSEVKALSDALDDNNLWPYDGRDYSPFMKEAVKLLRAHFAVAGGPAFVVPSASGTSSIQIALGGLKIRPGSEVIVTPITDPGSVTPIIFHNAIPVFADVDMDSGLITPATVENVLTHRTSAVIAVHLTGSPVDVPGIRKMLDDRGRTDVRIIEDVAQGLGASLNGTPLGMLGDAGCFSLNSHKHVSVGEGGFVLLRDEDDYHRSHNFSDKHRDRLGPEKTGEHARYMGPGHSLRMSELQGAMLTAQMPKLTKFAQDRHDFGMAVADRLATQSDLVPQAHIAKSFPTFFGFMFRTQNPRSSDQMEAVRSEVRNKLKHLGAWIGGSYTSGDLPIYKYPLFENRNFAATEDDLWPAELVAQHYHNEITPGFYDYSKVSCPVAEKYLERAFWLGVHESYTTTHAEEIADTIIDVFVEAKLATRV